MLTANSIQHGLMRLRVERKAAILRYALVGSCAAALQIALLTFYVEILSFDPLAGSSCALIFSIAFNYYYQRRLTFKSCARHATAGPTFVLFALSTLLANAALFSFLLLFLPYVAAQIVTMTVIFPINYLLNRRITFRT